MDFRINNKYTNQQIHKKFKNRHRNIKKNRHKKFKITKRATGKKANVKTKQKSSKQFKQQCIELKYQSTDIFILNDYIKSNPKATSSHCIRHDNKNKNNTHNISYYSHKNTYRKYELCYEINWLWKLKAGDKVDILDHGYHPPRWLIATILNRVKLDNINIQFYLHYDGWRPRYDEWIHIRFQYDIMATISPIVDKHYRKLQPFHTNTPYHYSLKHLENCNRYYNNSKTHQCETCNRKCCSKCFIVTAYIGSKGYHLCNPCASYSHYKYLFSLTKLMYDSIFREQHTEKHIINMITNYSFINIITCNNQIDHCSRVINMEYATDIQHVKCNQTITLPKIQHIVCNHCYNKKQTQKFFSKCEVFHDDLVYCSNGCNVMICNKCDIKKHCANTRCSFTYYKCCTDFTGKCEYHKCFNQNVYCKPCAKQLLKINDCSCGIHIDICHTCDHYCYRFFKCNSILRRVWNHEQYKQDCNYYCANILNNSLVVSQFENNDQMNICIKDNCDKQKEIIENVQEMSIQCNDNWMLCDYGGKDQWNKHISKWVRRKWKYSHNNQSVFLTKMNNKAKRRKKKRIRRDLNLFLKKKQYLHMAVQKIQ